MWTKMCSVQEKVRSDYYPGQGSYGEAALDLLWGMWQAALRRGDFGILVNATLF